MSQFETKPWHVTRPASVFDTKAGQSFQSINPEGSQLPDMIDIREEIGEVLQNRGHNVFVRRADDRRCGCWNEVTRESQIDCPHCTGTGWLYSDFLYKARKMSLTDPVVGALLQRRRAIGLTGVPQFIFWLEKDAKPSIRDQILEVTLDEDTGLPIRAYNIETIWNIGLIQDFRDKNGRIEFWGCWVRKGALGKE